MSLLLCLRRLTLLLFLPFLLHLWRNRAMCERRCLRFREPASLGQGQMSSSLLRSPSSAPRHPRRQPRKRGRAVRAARAAPGHYSNLGKVVKTGQPVKQGKCVGKERGRCAVLIKGKPGAAAQKFICWNQASRNCIPTCRRLMPVIKAVTRTEPKGTSKKGATGSHNFAKGRLRNRPRVRQRPSNLNLCAWLKGQPSASLLKKRMPSRVTWWLN